jgi:hypothetical protein
MNAPHGIVNTYYFKNDLVRSLIVPTLARWNAETVLFFKIKHKSINKSITALL